MIDELLTFKYYGYYSYELSKHSSKPIIVRCDSCKETRTSTKHALSSMCMGCCQKGKIIPLEIKLRMSLSRKGFKHSKESRLKMSISKKKENLSKEIRRKISLSKIGQNNPQFGKLNPNYKHGAGALYTYIRTSAENRQWIKAVFERDNYTCQRCGQYGGKLEAHHCNKRFSIIFKEFLKEYDQFSPIEDKETLLRLATKYKQFFDVENGETLCKFCHALKTKETVSKIKNNGEIKND
jgi:hypothetical protein